MTWRILFTLIAFVIDRDRIFDFETTLYLPLFVFGLLIPIGLLSKFFWNLKSK
jgi:hypothetical protein